MIVTLLLAHPDPTSFNHALSRAVLEALEEAGHEVRLHDLYAERFDPLMSAEEIRTHRSSDALVERHAHELAEADGLVIVHPVWFDAPPAVLKGWIDRVVRDGTAYDRTEDGGFQGRLRTESALLITTANAPYDAAQGDALDHLWRDFVLAICGIGTVDRLHLTPVVASDLATRRAWLEEASERAERLFGRSPLAEG